jgi:hypothetical protein
VVQFNYSQPAVQISQTSDGVSVPARNVQSDYQVPLPLGYQVVGKPSQVAEAQAAVAKAVEEQAAAAKAVKATATEVSATEEWPGNSQNHTESFSEAVQADQSPFVVGSDRKTWLVIGLIALVGVVFVGGLALVIIMLLIPKTRAPGIAMLLAGLIMLVVICVGFFLFGTITDFGGIPGVVRLTPQQVRPRVPIAPIPIASPQTPANQSSQGVQQTDYKPNSKELVNVYELLLNDYKTLTRPLKLEIKDDLKEKVGTLRINVQDIGQVTISGSSFLINSIGQALAKAMTEKMKENNAPAGVAGESAVNVSTVASVPSDHIAAQPTLAVALEHGSIAEKPPAKSDSVEVAKTSPAAAVESAVLPKSDAVETAKAQSESKRPDWVGKPPFLYRLNSSADFPAYYQAVNSKPREGDCYVMSISTDPYTTTLECEAKIPEVLQSAVYQFVERYLGRQWMGYVQLSPDQLRQLVVTEYEETKDFSVGKMTQVHLLLNFDKKVKTLIDEAIHVRLFNNRAAVAGAGFVALWLLLAVIWGYLKLDLSTKGAYRNRLRAAAGFTILIILTMTMSMLVVLA